MDLNFFSAIPKEYTDPNSSQCQKHKLEINPGPAKDKNMLPRGPTFKIPRYNGLPPGVRIED